VKVAVLVASVLGACTDAQPMTDVELPSGEVFISDVCIGDAWPYLVSTTTSLFWISTCDASIRRASKLDGSVQVVASNEPSARMLAADESNLYWARIDDSLRGELVRASQADGVPIILAPGQREMLSVLPQQLVIDDTNVYRSEFFNILSVPKDGSAAQQVVAKGTSGPFLAVDADYLYWASHASVHRQRKGTDVDEELATSYTIWEPLAVTERAVYFWAVGGTRGLLNRIDKTGGPAVSVLEDWPAARAFVSDGESLYWQSGATVVRAADDGPGHMTVTPLVAVDGTALAFALDDTFLYWVAGSTIYRARR
jgi:hypothetical protein